MVESLPTPTLVLLPGLDGTGDLFARFVSSLPPSLLAKIVCYPTERPLSYAELFPLVMEVIPQSQPFVLVAESFSTPLAAKLAGANLAGLKGLVICTSFISNPIRGWLRALRGLARPILFRVSPPQFVLNRFLIGAKAPRDLRNEVRRTLRSVPPEVLAFRVQAVMTCDATEELARISVPILYLQAGHDRLVGKSAFEEISKLKPDVILKVISGPHLLLQREPQKAADTIMEFIAHLP